MTFSGMVTTQQHSCLAALQGAHDLSRVCSVVLSSLFALGNLLEELFAMNRSLACGSPTSCCCFPETAHNSIHLFARAIQGLGAIPKPKIQVLRLTGPAGRIPGHTLVNKE